MKWFCHIFSLYLLTLSCLPCSDGGHDHVRQAAGTPAHFTSANSFPEHTQCDDTCSPFCGCHCCSVTFTIRLLPAFEFQKITLLGKKRIFPNLSFRVNDVALAIEHPPQLV